MKAIAIVGHSKTGKTTLCEALIQTLTARGYRVGSVKEIHAEGFSMDDPATNTGRHRAAGAQTVVARGPAETDVLFDHSIPPRQLLSYFDEDYVILEGVRDVACPLIQSAASPEDLPTELDPRTVAVSVVIANGGLHEVRGLPVLNPLGDPDALADFVEGAAFPLCRGWSPNPAGPAAVTVWPLQGASSGERPGGRTAPNTSSRCPSPWEAGSFIWSPL